MLILEYDNNPNLTPEERIQSLKESVQRALEEIDTDAQDSATQTRKVFVQIQKDFDEYKKLYVEDLKAIAGNFQKLKTDLLEFENAVGETIEAKIGSFEKVFTEELEAQEATIKELDTKKLSAEEANIKYANIDFSNIKMAAVKELFTKSGIIKDLVVGDQSITGELVGVTIKGDLIEGNTVVADKLVIKGEDGIYYKLNIEGGVEPDEEITKEKLENGLHGSIIIAKTITAEKINVLDLVAFGATIGGFHITDDSIYSGVKESIDNSTEGLYIDSEGQLAVGDNSNFLKVYKDDDGSWKIELTASAVKIGTSSAATKSEVETVKNSALIESYDEYATGTDAVTEPTNWSTDQPQAGGGIYIWRRPVSVYGNGDMVYGPAVCLTGNKGDSGEDAVLLYIDSSRGNAFKNNEVETTLTVMLYKGAKQITDIGMLHEEFGATAYLEWQWLRLGENQIGTIVSTDSRIGNDGFTFQLTPDDVDTKVVFDCVLHTDD